MWQVLAVSAVVQRGRRQKRCRNKIWIFKVIREHWKHNIALNWYWIILLTSKGLKTRHEGKWILILSSDFNAVKPIMMVVQILYYFCSIRSDKEMSKLVKWSNSHTFCIEIPVEFKYITKFVWGENINFFPNPAVTSSLIHMGFAETQSGCKLCIDP